RDRTFTRALTLPDRSAVRRSLSLGERDERCPVSNDRTSSENPVMIRPLLSLLILAALAISTNAAERGPSRMLFVTQSAGFKHGAVTRPEEGERRLAPAEVAMIQLGQQTGLFACDVTQDVESDFTKENLQKYDIVAFYTTGELPIAEDDREYFINDWLRQ